MPEEQVANVSEILQQLEQWFTEMVETFQQKSDGFQAVSDLFYNLMTNETAHHNTYDNKEQRKKVVSAIKNMMDASKQQDPITMQRFSLLISNLGVARAMIQTANKEGVKIV